MHQMLKEKQVSLHFLYVVNTRVRSFFKQSLVYFFMG